MPVFLMILEITSILQAPPLHDSTKIITKGQITMGILIAVLSALTSTAKDVTSKTLGGAIHPDISTCSSFLFALPYYVIAIAVAIVLGYEQLLFSKWFIALVLLRSITDVFAEGCKMRALTFGDISLVASFLSLSPLLLAIISPMITDDIVTVVDLLALSLIVCGSFLLIQRDMDTGKVFQLKAILYACGASIAFSLNHCFDRLVVSESSPLMAAFAVTFLASIFTLPIALRRKNVVSAIIAYRRPLLVRGGFETMQLVSKLIAMSFLEAHIVVGILRLSLLSSVLSGRLYFKETRATTRLIPSLLIYLGLITLIMSHL